MLKDVVHLSQNDEFYLVIDTEGNIGIICLKLIKLAFSAFLLRTQLKE
jgi:hypothetical protein